jgi:hypothetical protein
MTLLPSGFSAWALSYGYDAAKRLTAVNSQAGVFGYAYDPVRSTLPSGVALPNGASIANSYDGVARLLSTTLKNSQLASLDLHHYGYNLAGQRAWLTNMHGDYRGYIYDNSGELLGAKGSESTGAARFQEQLGYSYDAAGNLAWRTDNQLSETFSVNAANELATAIPSGTLTVAGGTSPSATSVTISG